ncbi:MAG: DUF4962 domain-containing protein [Kiritimatiellae bacterium]|nr:DUF4962 domain-containing protein [Kiritimatiellia bacterium]
MKGITTPRRLRGALMLGLVSAAAMSTAPGACAAAAPPRSFAVEPGHPRIFFTAKDLPALRKRIQTTHSKQWLSMKKWADGGMAGKPSDKRLGFDVPPYAFLYRLSGERAYAERAIALARKLAALDVSSNDLANARRARALACAYDWCYDRLTPADKAAILKGLDAHVGWLYERLITRGHYTALDNHRANDVCGIAIAGFAMHREHPNAEKYIDAAVSVYKKTIIPALRQFGGPGDGMWHEGLEYTRHELLNVFRFFKACAGALGEDFFEPGFEHFGYGTVYGTYPDSTLLREGDNHFPGVSSWERKYMSMLASRYRNPHAQWYVNHMTKPITGLQAWYDILWYDPAVPETPPDALPLTRCFEGFGMVVIRTGWYEPDATVVTFRCGDFFGGHDHCNQNDFIIYRKGCLAVDSGGYDSWGSRHWRNYYSRTVAHNTITVLDPDEDRAHNFNNQANDGGQILLYKRDGTWNLPTTIDKARQDPQYDTGDIVVLEQGDGYTRTLGDATRAYSPHKLKQFTRELVVLHPKIKTNPPAIVVFDRVRATKPEYAKKWLLHTEHRPEQVGPGAWRATEGDGTLYVGMLEPQGAGVTLVGGPGREFEVNGKNYPPSEKTRPKTPPNYLGNWRIEIEPPKPAERDLFLNVLIPADKGQSTAPAVSRMETENMLGSFIQGDRGEPDTVVWFARDKDVLDKTESLSYSLRADGPARHLVADLPADVDYEVRLDGKLVRTQRTQDTRTETAVRKHLAPSSSLCFTTPAGPAGGAITITPGRR